jgi:hypothetical protein
VSTIFFRHYLFNGTIFGKKVTEHKMCVLIVIKLFYRNSSRSRKKSARNCHKCEKSSCKVPVVFVGF